EEHAAASDAFGFRLALSGDTLAVGAPWNDEGATDGGAVFVFRRQAAGVWQREAIVRPRVPGEVDVFGIALALRGDVLVAGAPADLSLDGGIFGDPTFSEVGNVNVGAAHVYRATEAGYERVAYLKAPAPEDKDFFGSTVATDGEQVFVAAPSGSQTPAKPVE